MTTFPPALAAHLDGEVTTLCHCWRVRRGDGAVLGFTDHDRPIACDGDTFDPETGLTSSEATSTLGLAVDTVDAEGALSSLDIDEEDIAAGRYDGATVETLLVNWRDTDQFALLRKAVIGRISRRDGVFVAELESLASNLDRPNGRIIRRRCDAELGDARCSFDTGLPEFNGAGTVSSVEGAGVLVVDGLDGFEEGWFANGLVTWTSGAATGRTERVTAHTRGLAGTALTLWRGAGSAAVEVGDGFTVVAGCDKQFATCKAKFANSANFRGFPHLPGNDAAYGYVSEGGIFDGGPLVE